MEKCDVSNRIIKNYFSYHVNGQLWHIKFIKEKKNYVHTIGLKLEYTGHHRTKRATNNCCGSLFLLASGGGSRSRSRILSKIEERAYSGTSGFFFWRILFCPWTFCRTISDYVCCIAPCWIIYGNEWLSSTAVSVIYMR